MKPVRISPLAGDDLVALADFVSNVSAPAALSAIKGIERALDRVGRFPGSGHRHHDLAPEYRVVTVGDWELVYREHAGHVLVLRIVHGMRDFRTILD